MAPPTAEDVRARLLAWFDAGHRDMPWRRTRDPYRILVAEVLLQRTRVVSGTPYYERFLERFPDVRSLAAAPEDEVLRAWEGLGFYRRARNLHAAARSIVRDHGGEVPRTAAELAALPGIGPYTAGAVASIAFGEPVPAVDGNATRVLSRIFRVEEDVSRGPGKARLHALAADLVSRERPAAFNQALMELGSTVCTPTSPTCPACPLAARCLARAAGVQESLPRLPRPRKPGTVRVAFAHVEAGGRTLLVRRPDGGLLGGLWSFPGGEVSRGARDRDALRDLVLGQTGLRVDVGEEVARIAHAFSHRRWTGAVYRARVRRDVAPRSGARWIDPREAKALPLVPFQRRVLESGDKGRALETFDERPRRRPP